MALSRTNDLMSQAARRSVGLRELLERELSAFGSGRQAALSGPDVPLEAQAGIALSMIFHELATNAAKYGALSVAGGQVEVTWARDGGTLAIAWSESGPGLAVVAPGRRGFGSLLIDRLARHQLGGSSRIEYRPDGLVATIAADGELVCARQP
jgi:two-component sensor histidine kinase